MLKQALVLVGLLISAQTAFAKTVDDVLTCTRSLDCPYLFDVYDGDKEFKAALDEFATQPLVKNDKWIKDGTASTSAPITLNGKTYAVFNVCKPHDCGDNYYILAYDKTTQTLAGIRGYDFKNLQIPLGTTDIDLMEMMVSYDDGELAKAVQAEGAHFPVTFTPK